MEAHLIYPEDQSVSHLGLLVRDIWQGIMGVVEWLWSPGPTDAVQEFFGYGWLWFFDLLALLGTVYTVAVVGSLALWFVGRRLMYTLLGAVALGTIVSALLWTLFSVPRPDAADISVYTHLSVPSFPSGHTMTATMLWGALAAFSRVPWIVPLLVVPAVMLSRLYLGAHYVGDVLASVLIGSFLLAVYFLLWPPIMRWLGRWPFWLFLVVGLCAPFGILLFMGTSSRGFELAGVALAMGVGLPLEYRYVRFKPAGDSLSRQALKGAIGLGGMSLLLFGHVLVPSTGHPIPSAALLFLAVLWAVLFAPASFANLGLSGRSGREGEA